MPRYLVLLFKFIYFNFTNIHSFTLELAKNKTKTKQNYTKEKRKKEKKKKVQMKIPDWRVSMFDVHFQKRLWMHSYGYTTLDMPEPRETDRED